MPLRVLIAPDKFKGTLTAREAARAISCGWLKIRRDDIVNLLPISDGGDGFGNVISGLLSAREQTVRTVDAAHRPLNARWWWNATTKTAIIESANVIGLAQLSAGKFHPFALDTFGLGAVIRAAARRGAKRCIIGIGGSATNDGGFGIARALGWKFLDVAGKPIVSWTELTRLIRMIQPDHNKWFDTFTVAVDVRNPLLGPRGCSRIYGPQKGLKPQDFPAAEKCLRRLAALSLPGNAHEPGAGAAGGLGFGLRTFLGARLEPGFDLFARMSKLNVHLKSADLVITGEGSIDRSTMMGKGVGEIARHCHELKIPCIGLSGILARVRGKQYGFNSLRGLTELTTAKRAQARAAFWLEQLSAKVAMQHTE